MAEHVDIVFDGPPGPEGNRFIEVVCGGAASPAVATISLTRQVSRRPSQ